MMTFEKPINFFVQVNRANIGRDTLMTLIRYLVDRFCYREAPEGILHCHQRQNSDQGQC